jgi:hypothetical protein
MTLDFILFYYKNLSVRHDTLQVKQQFKTENDDKILTFIEELVTLFNSY